MTKCVFYTISLLLLTAALGAAEEKRYGFTLDNWQVLCTDYRGGTEPVDSIAIQKALRLEGWQTRTREEVKAQCQELRLPVAP